MRAMAFVAHPDDCVIYAWPFIEAHPEFRWEIVYLTNKSDSARAREVAEYWQHRNTPVKFLGFPDDWNHVKNGQLGFDPDQALEKIKETLTAPLILTHNPDGDYGHVHHVFASQAANHVLGFKVYFASTFNRNVECLVREQVNIAELPLHAAVVSDHDLSRGYYYLPDDTKTFLNNYSHAQSL